MRYLLVAPQLGYSADGQLAPGGLLKLGRCVALALASAPGIEQLGIWAQADSASAVSAAMASVQTQARAGLRLDVRFFNGSRVRLGQAVWQAGRRKEYDRVGYLLVNQAVLSQLPGHPPYDAWEIGVEVFEPLGDLKRRALQRAERLLSISAHTSERAMAANPGLRAARVVHPGLEPEEDAAFESAYDPAARAPAVLIAGNMYRTMPYKGHRQLIEAWPAVLAACPEAELWIVGGGDGRPELEAQARALPLGAAARIMFLGQLDDGALQERYRRCRAFAMPSTGEGFGLVFVEAARHGVPCIGCRRDAAREIILDGETGLLVEQEPGEIAAACLRLLTDDDLAHRLGEAGRERYRQNFRFEDFRGRLLAALEL